MMVVVEGFPTKGINPIFGHGTHYEKYFTDIADVLLSILYI